MESRSPLGSLLLFTFCLFSLFFLFSLSAPSLHSGIHPLDEKYYDAEVINCKDGSKSFAKERLNDDFCDCPDGTDEPGTSACPGGRFYCRNVGSTPRFLFSSRVNDHICDCCDGSDENDGTVICPNSCIIGGNFAYQTIFDATRSQSVSVKRTKLKLHTEDSVQKLKGLKQLVVFQVLFIISFTVFWLFRRRTRSKRRSIR